MIRFAVGVLMSLSAVSVFAGSDYQARAAAASTGEHRSESNIARNIHRHPAETLAFFGFEDGMSVLEIWPGSGWYTEVLAPAIHGHGQLTIATWDPEIEGQPSYRYELPPVLQAKIDEAPEVYGNVETVYYLPPDSPSLGDDGSYDLILTFRNTHGWVTSGLAPQIYAEFARVLKPGGVLGVVQHRAADDAVPEESANWGYLPQSYVVSLIEDAGFELMESSEINANPKDSRDHPEGVWTLPPGYALGDQDREKYEAIGESDRMTLKFRKK